MWCSHGTQQYIDTVTVATSMFASNRHCLVALSVNGAYTVQALFTSVIPPLQVVLLFCDIGFTRERREQSSLLIRRPAWLYKSTTYGWRQGTSATSILNVFMRSETKQSLLTWFTVLLFATAIKDRCATFRRLNSSLLNTNQTAYRETAWWRQSTWAVEHKTA